MIKNGNSFSICFIAALTCCLSNVAIGASSLGVCAHVTRDEFGGRVKTYEMMHMAGLDYVRTDFDWWQCQKKQGAAFDFAKFDAVVDDAAKMGIRVLPVLIAPPGWACPVERHLDAWSRYVTETVSHFKGRVEAYEVWNEENFAAFWPDPNPTNYLALLKVSYAAVKSADPGALVLVGGFAGVPLKYIEELYKLGGATCFDVMNVHPYCWPEAPEGRVDKQLNDLCSLMARYGDGQKPVWITEIGWPTEKLNMSPFRGLFKAARPNKNQWRAVYVPCADAVRSEDRTLAMALEKELPAGSLVRAASPDEFNALMDDADRASKIDAVIFPFTEDFPDACSDTVVEFVNRGGVLVDCGGSPMWYGKGHKEGPGWALRERLRIEMNAWWLDKALGETMLAQPTKEGRRAGIEATRPDGPVVKEKAFSASRFVTGRKLKLGDSLMPLIVAKDKNGKDAVTAGIYRYGDMKGCVAISALWAKTPVDVVSEERQADYTRRMLKLVAAASVERTFLYEFRAPEKDDFYSEDHFGIVHADFSPKPAYEALKECSVERVVK